MLNDLVDGQKLSSRCEESILYALFPSLSILRVLKLQVPFGRIQSRCVHARSWRASGGQYHHLLIALLQSQIIVKLILDGKVPQMSLNRLDLRLELDRNRIMLQLP